MAEFRGDVIASGTTAIHAGAGILFPSGTYLRTGIVGGAGLAGNELSVRGDIVAAFHLDPFRETRHAPYAGGGISFRRDSHSGRSRAYLLAFAGLEGRARGKFVPAFEVGVGGGIRAGVIFRRPPRRKH